MNIVREPRKSFAAEVVPDGAVTIKAPLRAGDAEINAFIERKTKWIEKQQAYFKQFNRPEQFEIISGGSVLYLGRQYQIIIEKAPLKNAVRVLKNKIYILSGAPPKMAQINADFQKWLLRRAEDVFAERLRECLKSFPDLPTPVLKIRIKETLGKLFEKARNHLESRLD